MSISRTRQRALLATTTLLAKIGLADRRTCSCWPLVPISAGDIKYFNSLEQGLNQVEANAAAANGATYVDTWDSSIGHDACKASGVAWVNGIVPTSAAFPLHPNQAGEANMARQVLLTLG
jgi:GDSL-like Lipase/Acylhydrolase family